MADENAIVEKEVFILMTDTENGTTFEAFGIEEEAQNAFIGSLNDVFGVECKTFEEAQEQYEHLSSEPFNTDYIYYEITTARFKAKI